VLSGGKYVLRLTNDFGQAGSAFQTQPISLASDGSFETEFTFQIGDSAGASDADGVGADGLVFVVQAHAVDALGAGGSGLGYDGIAHSVGIEFDTFEAGEGTCVECLEKPRAAAAPTVSDGNHVGINLDGSVASVAQAGADTRLNDGAVWRAWIKYDGTTDMLDVFLSTSVVQPTTPILSHEVDLPAVLGATTAFVGFTSGTGGGSGDHDIITWKFKANSPPVVHPNSTTTREDNPVTLTLSGGDDGGVLHHCTATPSANASVSACAVLSTTRMEVTYTPKLNYHGSDAFTYTASDGVSTSAPATVTVTVTPDNDPPVANPGTATARTGQPVEITLVGSDVEGAELFFDIDTSPLHGTLGAPTQVSATSARVTYTPTPNYHGPDSFTFSVWDDWDDQEGESSPATVGITVIAKRAPSRCARRKVTIRGTAGNDNITGTNGNDVIDGGDGDDHIRGMSGNDVICGGKGNDQIFGNLGNDQIVGGPGHDYCDGNSPRFGDLAKECEILRRIP